ncbi:L-threonylcarbamoyladenylate synthase [Micromonospora zhanjiangensis]|uniref:L-threonylcarbamoyladenylate synthase n=1 Tax=Micromonospora zhanjiangensis TaxID=1522057 RepID=A0ABV8KST0_9ACTN
MLYDCRSLAERDRGVAAAVEAVKNGELVVLPTDTVYGIGCDAFTPYAVKALLAARDAGQTAPGVLVGSRHTLDGLVYSLPQSARDLVEAYWPGPLTVVVEHSPSLQWDLGETGGRILVRMPLHPLALEVLRETGPMALSSANKVNQPAARDAETARDQFGYAVRAYLDAGPCGSSLTSTIVDVTGPTPQVLREGALSFDQVREVLPDAVRA